MTPSPLKQSTRAHADFSREKFRSRKFTSLDKTILAKTSEHVQLFLHYRTVENPRVLEFLGNSARFDLAGLGLFDPVVMGLLAAIGLVAAVAMRLMPKPTAKTRAHKTARQTVASPTASVSEIGLRPSAPVGKPLGDGLARLRTIIETGAAQSEKMSSAHAGASVKIDAAEHALNRMILEMNAVLHPKSAPTVPVIAAVPDVVHGLATAARGRVAA